MRPLWVFPTSPITRTSTCLHPFSGPRGGLLNKLQIPLQLAAAYGPPTFFVTFTCNADWPEIQSQLRPGQDFTDVPIVVVRVFRQKLSHIFRHFHMQCRLARDPKPITTRSRLYRCTYRRCSCISPKTVHSGIHVEVNVPCLTCLTLS